MVGARAVLEGGKQGWRVSFVGFVEASAAPLGPRAMHRSGCGKNVFGGRVAAAALGSGKSPCSEPNKQSAPLRT